MSHDPAYSDLSDRELRDLRDATYEQDAEHDTQLATRDRLADHQEHQARTDLYPVRRVDVSAPVPVLGHFARGRRDIEAGTPVNPKPWENPLPSTVPCVMCGNPASRLAGEVFKPDAPSAFCCSKECMVAFVGDTALPRYRVRYQPNPKHQGPWALIDTAKGDDHVAGRSMTEDFALRWAKARNEGEQDPVETPEAGLAEVRVLRAFATPARTIGGEAA